MATMKLRFDAALGVFEGQPMAESVSAFSLGQRRMTGFESGQLGFNELELGAGNQLSLSHDTLFANLRAVQERNGIAPSPRLDGLDVAIEMETGTGKTYVYLRTAFELHRTYGFTKFMIVVPSVPIREGVLHSIQTMREHFKTLYGVPFDHFVYDSKQLGKLRAFAQAATLQLMIINIQAFQRDVKNDETTAGANVIYVEQDRLSGNRPIDFLRATRPIVILDEPQKLAEEASAAAIRRLEPLCTLRYSATYESANKIYRLGPIEALDRKLVKRIEVASVTPDQNLNDAYIQLLKTDGQARRARLTINAGAGSAGKQRPVAVKPGDDLFVKSDGRQEYRGEFIVSEISFESGNEYVAFANGVQVGLGANHGGLDEDVMRAQIRETVLEHFRKERQFRPRGVKVLSLFFIDRVANYRQHHDDGSWSLGKIGVWFEAAFAEVSKRPEFAGLVADPVERVHDGYFSKDRKGGYRDTTGETKQDDDVYELIMRDKERLLSFDEPLRFIFSHSALREGWDNPNVFQICTLNETRSVVKKRQEIGRGLRLPVNQDGDRIHDEQIARLTVIANESYKSFAEQLQTEYEQDCGIAFGKVGAGAFAGIEIARDGEAAALGRDDSVRVWEHLRARGYLDREGKVLAAFDPAAPGFTLDLPDGMQAAAPAVIDAINAFVFDGRIVRKPEREKITVQKTVMLNEDFIAFWNAISRRTRYWIAFDTEELIRAAAARIRAADPIRPLQIAIEKVELTPGLAGVAIHEQRSAYENVRRDWEAPDILGYLANELDLTRRTIARILAESGRAEELRVNPQHFIGMARAAIAAELHALAMRGIDYEPLGNAHWAMSILEPEQGEELERYLANLYETRTKGKTPYDRVEFQSKVEQAFAAGLDGDDSVTFYVKLPAKFQVETPVGPYNPDWAIAMEPPDGGPARLYLIRETKGTRNPDELRGPEQAKIACGRKHFAAIGVNYDVATTFDEVKRALAASRPAAAGSPSPPVASDELRLRLRER